MTMNRIWYFITTLPWPQVIILILAYLLYCVACKKNLWGLGGAKTDISPSTPKGNFTSRLTEAVLLGCVLTVAVVYQIHIKYAWVKPDILSLSSHQWILIGAGLTIFVSVITAIRYPVQGYVIAIILLILTQQYTTIQKHHQRDHEVRYKDDVAYTISVNDQPGADIWVNDVYLGKSPVLISLKEFIKKVPYRPVAPATIQNKVEFNNYSYRDGGGWGSHHNSPWIKISLPKQLPKSITIPKHKNEYYAKVKHGDAIGYCRHAGGGGSSSNNERFSAKCRLHVDFPLRRHRLEKLLDMARLADYDVDEPWLKAIDSYGNDAWKILHNAAYHDWHGRGKYAYKWLEPQLTEPNLVKVMNAWVDSRFSIDKITTPKEAWHVFIKLRQSIDQEEAYNPNSFVGYALKRLIPKLDKKQLVDCAIQLIRTQQFNFGRGRYPSGDLIIDSIRLLDQHLETQTPGIPNIVERDFCAALLSSTETYGFHSRKLAVELGSPSLIPYLKRNWQTSLSSNFPNRMSYSSSALPKDINNWLLLLANTRGEEADVFRLEHQDELIELTQQLAEHDFGDSLWWGHLDYLTFDTDLGKDSIGAQTWPNYFKSVIASEDEHRNEKLKRLWAYLIRIEPIMPAETYVQCWQAVKLKRTDIKYILYLLDILPPEKRRQILEGLQEEIRLRPENIKDFQGALSQNSIDRLLKWFDDLMIKTDPSQEIQTYMNEFKDPTHHQHKLNWLIEKRSHLEIGLPLSESDNSESRKTAVSLLANHPTPKAFQKLQDLAKDPDSIVQQDAKTAIGELLHFKDNLQLLHAQTGQPNTSQLTNPLHLSLRHYPWPTVEHSVLTCPVNAIHKVSRLQKDGFLLFHLSDITLDKEHTNSLPRNGWIIASSIDQDNDTLNRMLEGKIYTWQLPNTNFRFYQNNNVSKRLFLDHQGNPIPNASLTIEMILKKNQPLLALSGFTTDHQGYFTVPDTIGRAYTSNIRFNHPDYGVADLGRLSHSSSKNVIVSAAHPQQMGSKNTLFGVVTDPNGHPIEGVKVDITGFMKQRYGGYMVSVDKYKNNVYTNEKGYFSLFPSGQNIPPDQIPQSEYRLRFFPPKETQLPPSAGMYPIGKELNIQLQRGGFYTISFKTSDGSEIVDQERIARTSISVTLSNLNYMRFSYPDWEKGACLPFGNYKIDMRDRLFSNIKVTAESPPHLIFQEEPAKHFTGRIVHGITGQILPEVFVIESGTNTSHHLSMLTTEQWQKLHSLTTTPNPDSDILKPIQKIRPFDIIRRTDAEGQFAMTIRADKSYRFIVFAENFMPYSVKIRAKEVQEQTNIALGDIKLFPAARVKISLKKDTRVTVEPFPVIAEDAPTWAQVFQKYKGFSYDHWHYLKQEPHWIHVPAEVPFQLRLRPSISSPYAPYLIEEKIHLKQGEELDLGSITFEPKEENES